MTRKDCQECGQCACCIARSESFAEEMAARPDDPPESLPAMAHSVIRRRCNRPQDWREVALAKTILAVYPADDGEAVTADRLRAIGWQTSPGSPVWVCAANGDMSIHILTNGTACRVYQGITFIHLPVPQTMGDVRRLCAAIGIPLT